MSANAQLDVMDQKKKAATKAKSVTTKKQAKPKRVLKVQPRRQQSEEPVVLEVTSLNPSVVTSSSSLKDQSLYYQTYTYDDELTLKQTASYVNVSLAIPTSGNVNLKNSILNWINNALQSTEVISNEWTSSYGGDEADGEAMTAFVGQELSSIAKKFMLEYEDGSNGIMVSWIIKVVAEGEDYVTMECAKLTTGVPQAESSYLQKTFRKRDGQAFDNYMIFNWVGNNQIKFRSLINKELRKKYSANDLNYSGSLAPMPSIDAVLKNSGVYFLYNPGEISSTNYSALFATVSYSDILPLMNPEAKAMFTDKLGSVNVGDFTYDVGDGIAAVEKYNGAKAIVEIPTTIKSYNHEYKVKSIKKEAFRRNSIIKTLTIPNNVDKLQAAQFYGCTSLASVVLPKGIKEIPDSCFLGCSNLTSFLVPNTVYRIGVYCFAESGLKYIGLNEGLKTIDFGCFSNCENLQTVKLPTSLNIIGSHSFYGCKRLAKIELPTNIERLSSYAFAYCTSLKEVKLNYTLEYIGNFAFKDCQSLDSIAFPYFIQEIGSNAFEGCYALKSAIMQGRITSIGDNCFSDCHSLTSVVLPAHLTNIGDQCFSNAKSLLSVTCLWMSPTGTTLGKNVFEGINLEAILYVPPKAKKYYKEAPQWMAFDKIKKFDDKSLVVRQLPEQVGK